MAKANWGNLGAWASGQPEHLPIPTDDEGYGPVPEQEARGYACRCGSRSCHLDKALKDAWRSGVRFAAAGLPSPPPPKALEPEQVQRFLHATGR